MKMRFKKIVISVFCFCFVVLSIFSSFSLKTKAALIESAAPEGYISFNEALGGQFNVTIDPNVYCAGGSITMSTPGYANLGYDINIFSFEINEEIYPVFFDYESQSFIWDSPADGAIIIENLDNGDLWMYGVREMIDILINSSAKLSYDFGNSDFGDLFYVYSIGKYFDDGYQAGYEAGLKDGYSNGFNDAVIESEGSYQDGYEAGKNYAKTENSLWTLIPNTIAMIWNNYLAPVLSFEILGVSVVDVVFTFVGLAIMYVLLQYLFIKK